MKRMGKPITELDLNDALADCRLLKYWQRDADFEASVKLWLARVMPSPEALAWFVRTLQNRVGQWPGPKEALALLATRFEPRGVAPGEIEPCSLPGFTSAEAEARYLAEHDARKALEASPVPLLAGQVESDADWFDASMARLSAKLARNSAALGGPRPTIAPPSERLGYQTTRERLEAMGL